MSGYLVHFKVLSTPPVGPLSVLQLSNYCRTEIVPQIASSQPPVISNTCFLYLRQFGAGLSVMKIQVKLGRVANMMALLGRGTCQPREARANGQKRGASQLIQGIRAWLLFSLSVLILP